MLSSILLGMSIAVLAGIVFLFWYYFATIIRFLADKNTLVTYPLETHAKGIMRNGRLHRFVMANRGHCFAGDLDSTLPEIDKWEVKPLPADRDEISTGFQLPFLKGIQWVGIPPFSSVYSYVFAWASLEEHSVDGKFTKQIKAEDKTIDYIFLREDVYATKIEAVECLDNIPLDVIVLISGRIVNPYKALFSVERWLEATSNLIDSRMRSFFGGKTYSELLFIAESTHEEEGVVNTSEPEPEAVPGTKKAPVHAIKKYFEEVEEDIEKKWGFHVSFIQIYSINPGSELAQEFIRATTLKYVAEQQRDANKATGEGLASRDRSHFEAISKIEGGAELFKWNSIKESNLVTYVDGGGVGVTIPAGQSRPNTNPRPNPSNTEPVS